MSVKGTLLITKKTFWAMRHDRRSITLMLLAPIIAMLLFGFAFGEDVKDIKVIVVNDDVGISAPYGNGTVRLSDQIIANIDPSVISITFYDSLDKAVSAVKNGDYTSVIYFPANFTRNILSNRMAAMKGSVNGSAPTPASITIRSDRSEVSVSSKVEMMISDAVITTMKQNGMSSAVSLDTSKPIYGSSARFIDMFVPGILGFIVFLMTTILTLLSFVNERKSGTLARLMVSPISEWDIVLGYTLAFGITGIIQVAVLLVIAILVFDIVVIGSLLLAFAVASLLAMVSVSLGILLSSTADTEGQAVQYIPLIVIPTFLLSGVFVSLKALPSWLLPFSYILPPTYAIAAMRSVFIRGWSIDMIWPQVLVLTGFLIVFLVVSVVELKRNRSR